MTKSKLSAFVSTTGLLLPHVINQFFCCTLIYVFDELCPAYILPSEPYSNVFVPVSWSLEHVLEIGIVIVLNDF